ncbi:MAG: TRAP transporter substrate-binding protein DctP [Candidatus Methylomirabilales bacterium]
MNYSSKWVKAILIGVLLLIPHRAIDGGSSIPIKFATLAPEGSTWMLTLREMDTEVRRRSAGQIHFVFYPGGVLGDEIDVLRKIRIGQLHGGAFSGVGLGSVLPSVRVLELPLLFGQAAEADFVTGRLQRYFARAFEKRGFIFLTFAEAGPVHLFSQKPIRRRQDLRRVRIWAWHGDPLAAALFRTYQVAPVPLALPDVFPSLHTGLIDAFYAPPLAAIALQWFSQVSYMSSEGLTRATGGMLISRSRWETIPIALRRMLRDVAKRYAHEVVIKTRQENQEALTTLKRHGIQMVDLDVAERRQLLEASRQVWEEQVGTLYPQSLLDQVKSLLQQYRGKAS